jgi:hypothetical protein
MVGIAGRMFTTLAQGNVNIEMISQGANEINISCVIDGRDAVKALNLIHQSCLQIKPEGLKGRGQCMIMQHRSFALLIVNSWALAVLSRDVVGELCGGRIYQLVTYCSVWEFVTVLLHVFRHCTRITGRCGSSTLLRRNEKKIMNRLVYTLIRLPVILSLM